MRKHIASQAPRTTNTTMLVQGRSRHSSKPTPSQQKTAQTHDVLEIGRRQGSYTPSIPGALGLFLSASVRDRAEECRRRICNKEEAGTILALLTPEGLLHRPNPYIEPLWKLVASDVLRSCSQEQQQALASLFEQLPDEARSDACVAFALAASPEIWTLENAQRLIDAIFLPKLLWAAPDVLRRFIALGCAVEIDPRVEYSLLRRHQPKTSLSLYLDIYPERARSVLLTALKESVEAETLNLVLSHMAPDELNRPAEDGLYPIHHATGMGDIEALRQAGASLDVVDSCGCTLSQHFWLRNRTRLALDLRSEPRGVALYKLLEELAAHHASVLVPVGAVLAWDEQQEFLETLIAQGGSPAARPVWRSILYLEKLEIAGGGSATDSWVLLASRLLVKADVPEDLPLGPLGQRLMEAHQTAGSDFEMIPETRTAAELLQDYSLENLVGRSAVFAEKRPVTGHGRRYLVLKVNKQKHSPLELWEQYRSEQVFYDQRQGLPGDVPEPQGVYQVTGLKALIRRTAQGDALETFLSLAEFDSDDRAMAYVYRPESPGYLQYIHNPSVTDKDFDASLEAAAQELFMLLKEGIYFDKLADMFHNNEDRHEERQDGGRFLALVDLMRDMDRSGLGRLSDWPEAVEYCNVREKKGLADRGKYVAVPALLSRNHALANHEFSEVWRRRNPRARLLANLIADYLMVFELICARRAVETIASHVNAGDEQEKEASERGAWAKAVERVQRVVALALRVYGGFAPEDAAGLAGHTVHAKRLQEQERYWYGLRYVSDLASYALPNQKELYGSAWVVIGNLGRGWNSSLGFALNGGRDTGPVNGPHLISEGYCQRNIAAALMVRNRFYRSQ